MWILKWTKEELNFLLTACTFYLQIHLSRSADGKHRIGRLSGLRLQTCVSYGDSSFGIIDAVTARGRHGVLDIHL